MSLTLANVGEVELLKRALNFSATGNVNLHLFASNTTPAEGDTVATYTEASASGYAIKTLTGTSWTISTSSGVTTASYGAQTFTFSAAQVVYGYFVTNAANDILLWAERFDSAPYNIPSGGGSVQVTPKITLE